MIYKIEKIFNNITISTNGYIKDREQLDYLIKKLLERRIIISNDVSLIEKYIIDYPLNFEQFCSYMRQIYKLDIEKQIENKIYTFEENFSKILRFLNFYSYSNLNSEDIYSILLNLNTNIENTNESILNMQKNEFLLRNLRDDIQKFLWEKLFDNESNQDELKNPDYFIPDPYEYHRIMQGKIEYEYEIIKTKKIHTDSKLKQKKEKKIKIEKAFCADRDIPIQAWKIPNRYFDREILAEFYYKCEALRELILSKYFQLFLFITTF